MNRAERRAYNKKHKTSFTKEDFEIALLMGRLKAGGDVDFEELARQSPYVHLDNVELVPDGTLVKLNYEAIKSRPQGDLTDMFKKWIEENKDKEFHITREQSRDSLVCLEEDDSEIKWLFDLYSDILVKQDDKWVPVYEIDKGLKDYVPADLVQNAESEENLEQNS